MPTQTKTIVFTDLAGYTQRTATLSQQEIEALAKNHEQHTLDIFAPFGGELVKSIGDSYMAVFDSATEAVKACQKLVEQPLPNTDMIFRASVATGDVQEISNDYFGNKDYFGEPVNLSARINSNTPAGEVWFSNRTRVCMSQSEIAWESVGFYNYKGIAEREECFRAVLSNACVLNSALTKSVQEQRFVVIRPDSTITDCSGKQVILTGFDLGSQQLDMTLHQLAYVSSGDIWLVQYTIPTAHRIDWLERGYQLIISKEKPFMDCIQLISEEEQEDTHTQTGILIDLSSLGDVSLGVVGIALPHVPLVKLIDGYSIDLLSTGDWGYNKNQAVLNISVEPQSIILKALKPGILVNSRGVAPGTEINISSGGMFRYRDWTYRFIINVGGLYQGVIIGTPTGERQFNIGDCIEVGRNPQNKRFFISDRGGADRIKWCTGPKAKEAQKQKLTLDRTLTGREHAKVQIVRKNSFVVSPIHPRLPTFVIPKGGKKAERVMKEKALTHGDMLIVGTSVLSFSKIF